MGLCLPESDNDSLISGKTPFQLYTIYRIESREFFLFFVCIWFACVVYFVYEKTMFTMWEAILQRVSSETSRCGMLPQVLSDFRMCRVS